MPVREHSVPDLEKQLPSPRKYDLCGGLWKTIVTSRILLVAFQLYGIVLLYEWVYSLIGKGDLEAMAINNARFLVRLEQQFGLFVEPITQAHFLSTFSNSTIQAVNNFYMSAHGPLSIVFFIWLWRTIHSSMLSSISNAFLIAHLLVIAIEYLFPCAPPRLVTGIGLVDTIHTYSHVHLRGVEEKVGVNPFAAMPSVHFLYAFVVGWNGCRFSATLAAKIVFSFYPVLVGWCIIVTGNHFVLDIVAAIFVWALACLCGRVLRARLKLFFC